MSARLAEDPQGISGSAVAGAWAHWFQRRHFFLPPHRRGMLSDSHRCPHTLHCKRYAVILATIGRMVPPEREKGLLCGTPTCSECYHRTAKAPLAGGAVCFELRHSTRIFAWSVSECLQVLG